LVAAVGPHKKQKSPADAAGHFDLYFDYSGAVKIIRQLSPACSGFSA
jgi:hypothetical protein